ncbi:MAG: cupin domain-containing protein [Bacteroidetes bacterium]|jgi:uncharacterized protein YjlB|nr:cupin domain-containing protein [Bacteroidota bacterium]
MKLKTILLKDDDTFPNNPDLPLVLMKNAVDLPESPSVAAERMESKFIGNNWTGTWRNGIYGYHHYHSNTHEVLGVCSGSAEVQFGGPDGISVRLSKGDVAVLPAGTAHKNLSSDASFLVVGAYPDGMSYDMNTGKEKERPEVVENIKNVPVPQNDPVFGSDGPLLKEWLPEENH